METILIVDDDKDLQFNLSSILKDEGYETKTCGSGAGAIKEVKKKSFNLVLLDIRLPRMDGMKVLEEMKKVDKDVIIIMLTAYADIKNAVKAMKLGAFDYITKPFDDEELILSIRKALKTQYLSKEVEVLRKRLGEKMAYEELIGETPQIKQVFNQIKIIAPTNMTVILQGESGTGKELIAQMIHQESARKDKPFVAIDCGAIPETLVESELFGYEKGAFTGAESQKVGKFEQANEGTLLLDEISNLPDSAQAKLLRVIQERILQHLGGKKDIKVDVRIIVATNSNLSETVRTGRFRNDLFHRLNEFQISLPTLRERREDISILSKYFLEEANQELNKRVQGLTGATIKTLVDYHWPGNVRELKNVIRRAVLLADSCEIEPTHLSLNNKDLPLDFPFQQDLEKGVSLHEISKKATHQVQQDVIKQTLARVGGNKTRAAKILKIDRMTLYSKIKEFQLE